MVSKLANDVTENLWQTKGLKHVIQAERDYASRAAQKYDRLMVSVYPRLLMSKRSLFVENFVLPVLSTRG